MNYLYSKTILIVDSSYYSAQVTSRQLLNWGFSTDVAHSVSAALKMLDKGEAFPDMIFVEVPNPNDAICKFPKEVHSNALWKSVPIIARGASSDRNISLTIEAGYCDYIVRPTEPDVLREKIEKALNQSVGIDAATFSVPIEASAEMPVSIELTGLSEFGVQGFCNHSLQPNSIVSLKCEFLSQFDLQQSNFRVIGCEEQRIGAGRYKIAMTFVGLRPQSARLIRKFSLAQSGKVLMTA